MEVLVIQILSLWLWDNAITNSFLKYLYILKKMYFIQWLAGKETN